MSNDPLRNLVAECLQIPVAKVADTLARENTPEWDSLNHLRLSTAIESELGITSFTMEEISSIKNVADLRRTIEAHRDQKK